jgi:hypothetical protein
MPAIRDQKLKIKSNIVYNDIKIIFRNIFNKRLQDLYTENITEIGKKTQINRYTPT